MLKAIPQKKIISKDSFQGQNPIEVERYSQSANLFVKTFEEIKVQQLICYKEGCLNLPFYECKCLTQATFICHAHLNKHLSKDAHKAHSPVNLDDTVYDQQWDKVANHLHDYNSDLQNLKKKIILKITEHYERVNKEVYRLFTSVDSIIFKNNQKILDLATTNLKILENMSILNLKSIKESTKKWDQIRISDECFVVIQAEISDWNSSMAIYEVAQIPRISNDLGSKLLHIDHKIERIENISFKQTVSGIKMPFLSWCEWQSSKVHFFDCYENTYKSIRISGLSIPRFSKSISIDHDNIFLCGGSPDDNIPETNENMSKAYMINIEKQSFKILASMTSSRTNHCITILNSFCYVFGGGNYQKYLINKCERYSLQKDCWEDILDLDHPRNSATCVSISKENCIYIIGGSNQFGVLDETIEKFDAAKNNWTLILVSKDISKQILSLGLGSCLLPDLDIILVFGGTDFKNNSKKECYIFYYKTNQVTNTNPILHEHGLILDTPVIYNNKVYCTFFKSLAEREISIYDIESGTWSIIQ